jgi:general secretion pathway protein B
MSFILDALKKAEAERQRQSGPTLLEVRVSSPRRRLPLWTLVLGVLLAINMILLLIFALRKPATAPATAPAAAMASAAGPAPAAAAASAAAASAAVIPSLPAPPPASVAAAPVVSAPGAHGAENPADDQPAVAAALAASSPEPDSASINPVDLPSLAELGTDMPDLRLDLHVYAEARADRYALINMHKVHEGDVLPEGPRVLQIFRDGVALSYRGYQFMLRPQ